MIRTKNIKQGLMIKASPGQVYQALMNSQQHAKFTGSPAKISAKVGGGFSAYDRYISGKNLELIRNKKIVQSWRGSDWPKGHYSIATFLLKPAERGTKLMFSHKGIPATQVKNIASGWKHYYWHPLKLMLEK